MLNTSGETVMQNPRSLLSMVVVLLIATIVGTVSILMSLKVFGPLPIALTQTVTEKASTFDVVGESEVVVVPDEAQVSIGITAFSPTASQAQQNINQTINAVVETVEKLGIGKEDIRTQNYSISPEYDYADGRQTQNGFRANATVRVSIKNFDQVNQVIDQSVAAGAGEVNGVNFTLSEAKEAETKQIAREQAIQDAKANAEELSGLAGMKLGRVVNVAEGSAPQQDLYSRSFALSEAAALSAPTQIEPGSQNYTYTVTLSYETL